MSDLLTILSDDFVDSGLIFELIPNEVLHIIAFFLGSDIASVFAWSRTSKKYMQCLTIFLCDKTFHCIHVNAILEYHPDLLEWLISTEEVASASLWISEISTNPSYRPWNCDNSNLQLTEAAAKAAANVTNTNKMEKIMRILEYLRVNNATWSKYVYTLVVENDHALEWLVENRIACEIKDLEIIEDDDDDDETWITLPEYPINCETLLAAIRKKNLNSARILHEIKRYYQDPDGGTFTRAAAKSGCLKMLQYLVEAGYETYLGDCTHFAIMKGFLDILQYTIKMGVENKPAWCQYAAGCGQLEILQYLHENGFKWNSKTFMSAAAYGDLHILGYLYENQCPWDTTACLVASEYKNDDVLQWLHDRGCPCSEENCKFCT